MNEEEKEMRVDEFDYELPLSAIAQKPVSPRDSSRLLVVNRFTKEIKDSRFLELRNYLLENDLLVVNNCKVIPARIFAKRMTGAKLELTLLQELGRGYFECLVKGKKPKPGESLELGSGIKAEVIEEKDMDLSVGTDIRGGIFVMHIDGLSKRLLSSVGVMALPPYIKRYSREEYKEDSRRYQTIFAKRWGAVASPTAGLHFSFRVLNSLKKKGIQFAEVTLFVSYGTFAPVRVDRVEDHRLHSEEIELSEESSKRINEAKEQGRRIIAVGTTCVRVLEHCAVDSGMVKPYRGKTSLFIYPGYRFKIVDGLITNFHLPRSTLLMLVCAFGGTELIKNAYKRAIDLGYRFLSYGDAMLIV